MATTIANPVLRALTHELSQRRKYFELEGIQKRHRTVRHWNRLHGVYSQLVDRIGEEEALRIWQQIERDGNYTPFAPGDKSRIGMTGKTRIGDPTIDWAEDNNVADWRWDESDDDDYDGTNILDLMQEDEELLGSWRPVHYLNQETIDRIADLIRKEVREAERIRRIGAADRKNGHTEALKESARQWRELETQLWEDYSTYDMLYEKPWIARTIVSWARGDRDLDETWLERIAAIIAKALHITQYAERYAPRYTQNMELLNAFWTAYNAPLPEIHDNYVERRSDYSSIAEMKENEAWNELDRSGVVHRPRTRLDMHLRHLGWTMTRKATAGIPRGKTARSEILYSVGPDYFYGYVRARKARYKMELTWEQLTGFDEPTVDNLVRCLVLAMWSDATCGTQYEHRVLHHFMEDLPHDPMLDEILDGHTLMGLAYEAYCGEATKTDHFHANLLEKELAEMRRRQIGIFFRGGTSSRPSSRPSAVR